MKKILALTTTLMLLATPAQAINIGTDARDGYGGERDDKLSTNFKRNQKTSSSGKRYKKAAYKKKKRSPSSFGNTRGVDRKHISLSGKKK